MLVWLFKEGENTPIEENSRKMRTWIKAEHFLNKGDTVVWWHSTFSHQQKKLLSNNDIKIKVAENFFLNLVHAGTYSKNLSFKRYFHGIILSLRYKKLLVTEKKPDLIICAFPPIYTTYQILKFAKKNNIPFILDVQDIWPDAIVLKLHPFLRPFGDIFFSLDKFFVKKIMINATSIVAVSNGFLNRCQNYGKRIGKKEDKTFYLGYREKDAEIKIKDEKIINLYSMKGNNLIFTFIGSFGLSYQIELLCKVAKKLATESQIKVQFVFAGTGENYEYIFNTYSNLNNISFLGWINETQIQELLSISDVGLVPCKSDKDTLPNKPFEYLSHGIPLLSSLEGEMEKMIEDFKIGLSYKCDDQEGLYNIVKFLFYSNELRENFKVNAKKVFIENFSTTKIYEKYIEHAYSVFYSSL